MTDQEIKDIKTLAEEYSEKFFENYEPDYEMERKWKIMSLANNLIDFVETLSARFCIVEKSKLIEEYKESEAIYNLYTSASCINAMESRAIDRSQGAMCKLQNLFGKELFKSTDNE